MNSKNTVLIGAIALALFLYIMLFERKPGGEAGAGQGAARLFPHLEPGLITAIEIQKTNSFLRVERAGAGWRLTHPVVYPAQPTAVEEFLIGLSELRRQSTLTAQEIDVQPGGRTSFGLGPPQASITLRWGTNRIHFSLGFKTPLADEVYVQLAGDPGVSVTESACFDRLPSAVSEWRNPMLVHDDRLVFDKVMVTNETGAFELVRDPTSQLWRLTKPFTPLTARADGNAVAQVIHQLHGARIRAFVSDDPQADLERFGLQAPKIQASLAQGTNLVFQIEFGNSPTNDPPALYARRLSHTNVVLVAREVADPLRQSHTWFRDRQLIAFSPNEVHGIAFKGPKESFQLHQTNGQWRITAPFQAPGDPGTIQELFASLARLEIIDFAKDVVTDFSAYGLAPPAYQYVLQTAATNSAAPTNGVLAQVDFGTQQVDRVFARRVDEPSVYTVSFADLMRLPKSAFEMRDRRLWSFASSNILSLEVTQRGAAKKVTRAPGGAWSTDVIENAALEETLHRLAEVRVLGWRAKGEAELKRFGFPDVDYQVALEVQAGGKTEMRTLKFGPLSRDGHPYAAAVLEEGHWLVFSFPGQLYQEVVRLLSIPAGPG